MFASMGPAVLRRLAPKTFQVAPTLRAFHKTAAVKDGFFSSSRTTIALRRASRQTAATPLLARLTGPSRFYYQQAHHQQASATPVRKLLVGGAIFGGTLVAVNVFFNRETRDDGGMPLYERAYLNSTFLHTGVGIGIIALSARQMIRSGFVYRIMVANPWVVGLGGMALSFATMIGTRAVDPDNYVPKYALWTAFNATQAAFVAPMLAFAPAALIARAGLYTVAMMGALSVVGATAKQEKYLYLGGPLLAGCAIVVASGLAPLVIPATAVRTLAFTENLWLWGGLAVFGGFTLYDVQKVLHHARMAERGMMKRDPINESISLELDFLNIFVRLLQILMLQQNRRK